MPDQDQSPPSDDDIVARLMALEPDDEPAPEEQPEPPQPEQEADAEEDDPANPDDQSEAEDDAEAEPAEELFELQFNGATEKVDKERAKSLAQQGLFYERKQAEVEGHWKQAQEVVKAVAVQMQAAPELREADAQVAMYQRALESVDLAEMQALATDDPAKYLTKLAEYNTLSRRQQEAQARRDQLAQQFMESQQRFQTELLAKERDALFKAVPDWRDQKKFGQARTRILSYMAERGFSEQELSGLTDHRALLVAYDAARFRESQKALKQSAKQLGNKPKVAKPGASVTKAEVNDEQAKALRQQLKKTGKVEDAAKFFERFV